MPVERESATLQPQTCRSNSFVANAFEGHHLFDPNCSGWGSIWYSFARTHEVIEKIPITPISDARSGEFAWFIKNRPQAVTRATLVGRFFAGKKVTTPRAEYWGGYGHFGCCSLFAIQQVIDIDLTQAPQLDYRASVDQPDIVRTGCGFKFLRDLEEPTRDFIKAQTDAEQSRDWVFTDPKRVATEGLAKLIFIDQAAIALGQTREAQGRFVYKWRPKGETKTYMMVVSRPYWLSFYASDPQRVAWVVIGAYEESCDRRNSVTRIR